MKKNYKIADKTIQISSIYERVHDYCKDYLSDGKANFAVSITQPDIDYERERSARTAELEGGEPLLGHKLISYMCRKLKENDIDFESTMITNCSLVTEELAKEISEHWNMKRIQVSLDGDKADYEKRKRYYVPDKHNYETVIRGIRFLAAEGLKIKLRCNVDGNNIDGLAAFVDQLKADIGNIENINLYLSPLFGVDKCRPSEDLFVIMSALTDYCRSIGLSKNSHNADAKFKVNYCMADSMDKTIGIGPDGEFCNSPKWIVSQK